MYYASFEVDLIIADLFKNTKFLFHLIMYDKHPNFHILSTMNTLPLSSLLTLYTGTHTDNLLSSLDILVQDFSMEHGEHNVISLDTPTWEDIVAEARAVPFFSDLKLIIARYSIALK